MTTVITAYILLSIVPISILIVGIVTIYCINNCEEH